MFTSTAEVFRTRQSVQDLLEVVRLHRDAVYRLGMTPADRSEIEAIVSNSCVIPDDHPRAYTAILKAAAMPDEDFNAFVAATAILLADRLQFGGGEDNLYWNFDAFRDHYRLSDPPVRAALMNGFRTAHRAGRVHLRNEPDPLTCLTRSKFDVMHMLDATQPNPLLEAIAMDATAKVAGQLWRHASERESTWSNRVGFRYLYERSATMSPDQPATTKLIPWS